jgi:sulfite exporter TauE/SafE/copper chaperone CopZ
MKTHTFHVTGMHCKACVVLIESELSELSHITTVRASLISRSLEVTGDFGDMDVATIARELSLPLEKHKYSLALAPGVHSVSWSDFSVALPAALAFVGLFVLLQKMGVANLLGSGNINYGTVFVVGLIASVSTCMAVVGGLVLSLSANFAKEGNHFKPQAFFHTGRFISFIVLGGLIGAAGSAFQLGGSGTFVMSLIVGIVMLVLGINLLDIFPWAKKLQPTIPTFLSKRMFTIKKVNHLLTPILAGAVTFFLPCGFTQSMQIYALSTGSFVSGALTMFTFAAGTFPVLALLSFGSAGIGTKITSGIFFKTAGLVVIFMALFNIINSFVVIGVLAPVFNF